MIRELNDSEMETVAGGFVFPLPVFPSWGSYSYVGPTNSTQVNGSFNNSPIQANGPVTIDIGNQQVGH